MGKSHRAGFTKSSNFSILIIIMMIISSSSSSPSTWWGNCRISSMSRCFSSNAVATFIEIMKVFNILSTSNHIVWDVHCQKEVDKNHTFSNWLLQMMTNILISASSIHIGIYPEQQTVLFLFPKVIDKKLLSLCLCWYLSLISSYL